MLNHRSQQPQKKPTDQAETQRPPQPHPAGEARVVLMGVCDKCHSLGVDLHDTLISHL